MAQGIALGYSWNNIIWLCKQSRLETGGNSRGLVEGRNAFGLGCARTRDHLQVGCIENNDVGIGKYRTLWAGVRDRFKWDRHFNLDVYRKDESYADAVAAVYHPSSGYADSVRGVDDIPIKRVALTALLAALLGTFAVCKFLKY